MKNLAVYVASKTKHAEMWKTLRAEGFPIVATWIDELYPEDMAALWTRCIIEAESADAVILYREPGDVLKGAFVEVGAAMACRIPVYAVGCDDLSFTKHPLVRVCDNLQQAMRMILQSW